MTYNTDYGQALDSTSPDGDDATIRSGWCRKHRNEVVESELGCAVNEGPFNCYSTRTFDLDPIESRLNCTMHHQNIRVRAGEPATTQTWRFMGSVEPFRRILAP